MKTISEISRKDCFGCELCANICPKGAIEIKAEDYFYYPKINTEKCIKCGKCFNLCPVNAQVPVKEIDKAYIAVVKDNSIYEKSTSGGFFGQTAHYFVKDRKGVAAGASFDGQGNVFHTAVQTVKDIEKLQGSKYVQCRMGDIYEKVENALKSGKQVEFGGTPCQVSAMRQRFGSNQNLYLIDIVCYGVPSPILFKENIKRYFSSDENIVKLAFRTKSKQERQGYNLVIETDTKELSLPWQDDAYYKLFMEDAIMRESCYNCKYACSSRVGDITISDCGNLEYYKDFNRDKNISTIYPVTPKGKQLWESVKDRFNYMEADPNFEMSSNSALSRPAKRPEERESVYASGKVDLDAVVPAETWRIKDRNLPTIKRLIKFLK